MYGKIMSISDQMMWRYYELLTDVSLAEIEKMKREAHPMQAKKELARRIVADFHSEDAAAKAGEDWARQFQKSEVPESAEEVFIRFGDIVPVPLSEVEWSIDEDTDGIIHIEPKYSGVRLDRLLFKCGLADSVSEAGRKIKQGSVKVNGGVQQDIYVYVRTLPTHLSLRVGKQLKVAVIRR